MSNNALSLPNPYLPGLPGSGLGTDLDEFAARVQQNMDAIALAIGSSPLNARGGSEIGYDQITSPVTVSSATEATGTTVITCAAHAFDGNPVMVEFFAPYVQPASGDFVQISLFEGATQIGRIAQTDSGAAGTDFPSPGRLRFTPTAGSHTYTVTARRSGADGTIGAGPGGTGEYVPAFIRFTKV